MSEEKITDKLYGELSEGLINKREFEAKVFEHLYCHYCSYGVFEKNIEDRHDFLSWLYPRFSRAVDRYIPIENAGFDTFLNSVVRIAYKEYKKTAGRRYDTEQAFWGEIAADNLYKEEDFDPYFSLEKLKKNFLGSNKFGNPKHLLIALLKSYYFVSDDFVKRIAPFVKQSCEDIDKLLDRVRDIRDKFDSRYRIVREQCFSQHFRHLSYERRIASLEAGSPARKKLCERADKCRERLTRMRERLKGIRIEASNKQLAEILGLPKGTVDSAMCAFRLKMKKYPDADKKPKKINETDKTG